MKKINLFYFLGLFLFFTTPPSVFAQQNTVTLKCKLENCSAADSITIYTPEGLSHHKIASARPNAQGEFTFQVPKTKTPQYYTIGINLDLIKLKYVLLGTEKETLLTGPCHDLSQTAVQNSPINKALADAQKKFDETKIEMGKILAAYNRDYNKDSIRIACEKQMLAVDKRKLAILDSLKKVNPIAARVLALDTYTSFQNSPKKLVFKSEIEYFATQYFQYVNWADANYNEIAPIFDAFRAYASVLLMPELKLKNNEIKDYFNAALKDIPAKSAALKFALTGLMSPMLEKQHPLIGDFGNRYLNDYPNDDPAVRQNVLQFVNYMRANMVDIPAPEIAQTDTAGLVRKLSDLKGKVVLIDFWASWCGPCRKENPTVVAAYKKYREKGFEVFSVSLDQDKGRWINAINQDGLVWPNHVSDLKYWQNEAAAKYSVTSIPRTVLIDRNGVITDHNLRGEALEKKLKEIFEK
jgi:thiol-disulfide isomerase/thioredoxin